MGLLVVASGCTTVPSAPTPAGESPTAATSTTATSTTAASTTSATPRANATTRLRKHPALDSRLADLLAADNRSRYAADHDLRVRNGSVLAVVELRENRSLPQGFDLRVDARHGRLVQAWIPIGRLAALADHRNVTFVRPPRRPVADSLTLTHPHR